MNLKLKNNNSILNILTFFFNYQFGKFVIVGIINTTINYVVFITMLLKFSVVYFISGALGFITGAISGFFINRSWTFKSKISLKKGFLRYFTLQLFCLCAHLLTQITAIKIFAIPEALSQLAGIFITTILNFSFSRLLVFKR